MKKSFAILALLTLLTGCIQTQPTQPTQTTSSHEEKLVDSTVKTDSKTTLIQLNQDHTVVDNTAVSVNDNIITIKDAGTYELTGTLTNGSVVVDASDTDDVVLILNNADITSQTGAPIYAKQSHSVTIYLADNSNNTLTDAGNNFIMSDVQNNEPNAAIYSRDDLILSGTGSLTVNAGFNNGIQSSDHLMIESGQLTITATNHGLKGNDMVTINGGTITISAGNDGIKTDNATDSEKGNIFVNGGTLVINATDDGLVADRKITINDGFINIQSSLEGLEAEQIELNGGTVFIQASDDAINASGTLSTSSDYSIIINGGELTFISLGDGLDSNGTITINDGFVLAIINSSADNGAMDADLGATINGGTVIFGGSGTGQVNVNQQGVLTYSGVLAKESQIELKDAQESLISLILPAQVSTLAITAPTIERNQSYQLLVDNQYLFTLQASAEVQGNMMGFPGQRR